ncbi:hypothetical protein N9O78_01070 [Flavobacteriaceae bacterium]|nr:hypothetical protein [Flavobacteriaceae bacterium]
MKKLLLLLPFIFLSCNKDDIDEYVDPMVGTWEGTVDLGGPVPFNTRAVLVDDGTFEWDIYLKNEEDQYIARYYWPSLKYERISEEMTDNWLYGKIEATETRIPFWSPASDSGTFSSETDGVEMPISWNVHYAVFVLDESFNSYELRNVCVPQDGQLGSDELCVGWEDWDKGGFGQGLIFTGTRVD